MSNRTIIPSYTRMHIEDCRHSCVYCGELADTEDHCPPISFWVKGDDEIDNVLVPACRECNSSLGDKPIFDVGYRAEYLITRYKKKYKKFDAVIPWDREEIEQLEGKLRKFVQGSQAEYDRFRARMSKLRHRASTSHSDLEK